MDSKLPLPFSAVLLAGGRSTRMGRDKAGLIVGGQPLWQRQLDKLGTLQPAELFISGHRDGPYIAAGVEIISDATPGLGPLGALSAVLDRATASLLVVLAIDLPDLSADLLATLITEARASGRGVVPQSGRWFEPLAAVYPRAALSLAKAALRSDDRSLQSFVARLIAAGLAEAWPIAPRQLAEFRNVNTPADL